MNQLEKARKAVKILKDNAPDDHYPLYAISACLLSIAESLDKMVNQPMNINTNNQINMQSYNEWKLKQKVKQLKSKYEDADKTKDTPAICNTLNDDD